ncbi:MAG: glycosyltransferase family 2 protein [Parcubacteria group bacterium]|jgi:glycosyltransferase involved in cell wall biosynthesis
MENNLPTISVYMATLNAQLTLDECLRRLFEQDYPKDRLEFLVGDGGSTDATVEIVKKYGGKVFPNPLKTAESGKAVALREAKNELALTLDSDNFLPDTGWLKKMVAPFADQEIMLSEPISYTWRREGGYIERYCALIGMNDPVCLFLGNYDRWNYLTQKWTAVPHEEIDCGDYLKIKLTKAGIPTVGANGTIFRTAFLQKINTGKYLFDIDVIAKEIAECGAIQIAKVKVGIIHTFCEADFGKFIRKQKRRIKDYTFHKKNKSRVFDWSKFEIGGESSLGLLRFLLYTVLIFPLFGQALIGYSRKKDRAWFFHLPACWVTLIVYAWGKFVGIFNQAEMSRENWKQ